MRVPDQHLCVLRRAIDVGARKVLTYRLCGPGEEYAADVRLGETAMLLRPGEYTLAEAQHYDDGGRTLVSQTHGITNRDGAALVDVVAERRDPVAD